MTVQKIKMLVVGTAFGIALVVACSRTTVGQDATASPADCANWQVGLVRGTFSDGPPKTWQLPAGWEPTGDTWGSASGSGSDAYFWARRCQP